MMKNKNQWIFFNNKIRTILIKNSFVNIKMISNWNRVDIIVLTKLPTISLNKIKLIKTSIQTNK
jgi:hypothetical protein